MKKARKLLAFGDVHFPDHNEESIAVLLRVFAHLKPDIGLSLGDLLNCTGVSDYDPAPDEHDSEYETDLSLATSFLDRVQKHSSKLVLIAGNHDYRIERWAAKRRQGKYFRSFVSLRRRLVEGRKSCVYIPYGSATGKYPHYKINSRLVAVHGWSYAKNATKNHLSLSQGMSVIHGHTHRADTSIIQNVWKRGAVIQARSAGCLCKQIPMYGTGRPVEWVNAFILGYLGSHDDTLYTIPIVNGRCILPDGKEIKA